MSRFNIQGFTLLEAMISVCIIATATLGISILEAKLLKTKMIAEQSFEASVLAQKKMEELRSFSTLTTYNAIANGTDSVTGRNATYTRAWTIATTASPSYKTVSLSVSWTSGEAVTETVTITSTIAGNDPYLTGRTMSLYNPVSLP